MTREQKTLQCVEFNNLYIDTPENIKRTFSILKILPEKSDSLAFAFIKHDKDTYDKDTYDSNFNLLGKRGELKKEHYHCYIKFYSPMPIDRFETTFGLKSSEYHVVKPKDFDNKLLYLTHCLHPDKYQYDISDISSNIPHYIQSVYDDRLIYKKENIELLPFVLDYINVYGYDSPIITSCLISDLLKSGYKANEVRQNIYLINTLVSEHNRYCDVCSEYMIKKSVDRAKENAYVDSKVKTIIDNFGFGRFDIDNETYIICKENK